MKTIEEAARDSYKFLGEIMPVASNYTEAQEIKNKIFKAGVEFAQRMIPVSEELPECNIKSASSPFDDDNITYSRSILFKLKCDDEMIYGYCAKYKHGIVFDSPNIDLSIDPDSVESWRYIELK